VFFFIPIQNGGGVGASTGRIKHEITSVHGVSARPHQFVSIRFCINTTESAEQVSVSEIIIITLCYCRCQCRRRRQSPPPHNLLLLVRAKRSASSNSSRSLNRMKSPIQIEVKASKGSVITALLVAVFSR
jgi:hypothetical protein